jgi:hypothetical protein
VGNSGALLINRARALGRKEAEGVKKEIPSMRRVSAMKLIKKAAAVLFAVLIVSGAIFYFVFREAIHQEIRWQRYLSSVKGEVISEEKALWLEQQIAESQISENRKELEARFAQYERQQKARGERPFEARLKEQEDREALREALVQTLAYEGVEAFFSRLPNSWRVYRVNGRDWKDWAFAESANFLAKLLGEPPEKGGFDEDIDYLIHLLELPRESTMSDVIFSARKELRNRLEKNKTKTSSLSSDSHVCASEEFHFIAQFPSPFEEVRMDSALGPTATFMSFVEETGVIFRIDAQRVKALENYADMTGEVLRSYLESSFRTYSETKGNSEAHWQWNEEFSWPVLEYSLVQDGVLREGVASRKQAYTFVKNKIHYTVSISTIPNKSNPNGNELKIFMAGFVVATPESIRDFLRETNP